MARNTAQPPPSRQVGLENAQRRCAACGRPTRADYRARRNVVTLEGVVALKVQVRVCHEARCPLHLKAIRAEEEGRWVLPDHEFGLDVIVLIGTLRHQAGLRVPAIHAHLRARGVSISERSVSNLLDRYEALLALRLADDARLQSVLHAQGRVLLALDGPSPWLVRDCLSGEVLAARGPPEDGDLTPAVLLLEVARALAVPIVGVVSDDLLVLRDAVASVLPGVPHHFRPAAPLQVGEGPAYAMAPPSVLQPGATPPPPCA
ncbi:hypothetical protein HPC49_37480 [Pyxidicoccus fallax]|uniref:Uncharacterized protein n=1 Tax=Pyxidicoccus fallax TaxID=394095 RepID=A0A848LUK0_9BACT|nr:hypothetical protein [Pyxidicoccus fallax]NMO21272.1 hypothetical protein [Pyxidicoccus fallax]NPC83894.1 hypothetical protein [Pyxidicoccus fallax]